MKAYLVPARAAGWQSMVKLSSLGEMWLSVQLLILFKTKIFGVTWGFKMILCQIIFAVIDFYISFYFLIRKVSLSLGSACLGA